jgi:glycosyl transferase family 25
MANLTVFLINLDGSDDRLASATTQIESAGVSYQRYAAFDGRGKNPTDFEEYDDQAATRFYGRPMTGGEMGCYFSHIDCAEAFLATDADYGLILEDDMLGSERSFQDLDKIIDWIENSDLADWDMINLCMEPRKFFSVLKTFGDGESSFSLVRAHYFPMTTTAILWSRAGAKRFLETRRQIYAPLDHFFRRWFTVNGRGLAVTPPLFDITGADSDLDNEGDEGPARKRVPRTFKYFWAEFKRQSVNYLAAVYHLSVQKLFRS